MADEITNHEDIIDSWNVIARIKELEEIKADADDWAESYQSEQDELAALLALQDEASFSPDWQYGEGLIRDSYFKEYAQELAEDSGMINSDAHWLTDCIDWDMAAEALKLDYFSVDFDGIDYWIRA